MKIQIAMLLPIVMTVNLILTPPLAAIDSDDEGNTAQVPPAPLTPPPQLTNTGDQKSEPLSPEIISCQNNQVTPPSLSSTLDGRSMPIRYTRSLGAVKQAAHGLTEVRQAFVGTLNAATKGNINGTVLRADVVTDIGTSKIPYWELGGGSFTVNLEIGDKNGCQKFNTGCYPIKPSDLDSYPLVFYSESSYFNQLVFDCNIQDFNITNAASFRKAFRTLLGLTREGTPARFTSQSSEFSVDGIMGAISHPTTPPGTYIAQYMGGGRMYLDNGYGTVESVEVPENAHYITFTNGITVELGYAFEPTEPMPQVGIVVE